MKLTPRALRILAIVSVLSLTGLVVLQCILLANAYEFRRQAFERNVFAAMNAVSRKLEGGEAASTILRVGLVAPGAGHTIDIVGVEQKGEGAGRHRSDSVSMLLRSQGIVEDAPLRVEGGELRYTVRRPQRVNLRVTDLSAGRETTLVDSFRPAGVYTVNVSGLHEPSGEFVVRYTADSSMIVMRTLDGDVRGVASSEQVAAKRSEILGRALDNLTRIEHDPIARRVPPMRLDSVVGVTLRESGIDLPYACGLFAGSRDSLAYATPAGYEGDLKASAFHAPLFPGDLLSGGNSFALHFPEHRSYLLRQMGLFLGLSGLFTTAIVLCFAYTLVTVRRQQEFGVRLTDFINNMTHEFKTPISTIAVAAETIRRPEIVSQGEKVLRYTEVIQEENARMKKQVDTILQMAVLEEGNEPLSFAAVDLHQVVRTAVGNIALQVEAKGGTVTTELAATLATVRADALHLSNMIHSLLDNANKYSPAAPVVTVTTKDAGAMIALSVSDRGIGIAPHDQKRVFERYFRVHTGNLHDVKGFGLGLSYVKLIAEAHGGSVSLESEPGRGTTVTLLLPRAEGGNI